MAVNDFDGEWITGGWWFYGGKIRTRIEIVAHDFDVWFRLDAIDGVLEVGREQDLMGPDGVLYQLRNDRTGFLGGQGTFRTIASAKAWADEQAWSPVMWDKPLQT